MYGAPKRPLRNTLNVTFMNSPAPIEISKQVAQTTDVIGRHLASTLTAIHLYGSALDGGLKPHSDIDLLVTIESPLEETVRQDLSLDLLEVSAPPGKSKVLRALEVTIVVHSEVKPWRYPVRRELQFGEWLRKDILAGIVEPAVVDADLAILLTQARQNSLSIVGPPAAEFFDPIPIVDFFRALSDILKQWESPSDWINDERNVLLTFARIWYSVVTGKIVPKDVAANWSLEHLPSEYQPVLFKARQAYLGNDENYLFIDTDQAAESIYFMKSKIVNLLNINENTA